MFSCTRDGFSVEREQKKSTVPCCTGRRHLAAISQDQCGGSWSSCSLYLELGKDCLAALANTTGPREPIIEAQIVSDFRVFSALGRKELW